MTKEQIKQVLVAEYGEDVLALPETERRRPHRLRDPGRARRARRDGARAARAALAARPAAGMATADGVRPRRARADGAVDLSAADAARLDEDLARYEC